MIEFLQDYTTKSLPPEVFKDGEQVERSPESELYFVRLGVAGYLVDGKLVGEDYQPIERKTVAVIVTTDRRFSGGRAGEVIGLDAPQRASTGPGNEVVFSGQPDSTTLSPVEAEQLRTDLAVSINQLDDHRTATTAQIEELTGNLTAAQGARETALADLATAQGERDAALADLAVARDDLAALREQHDGVSGEVGTLREKAEADAKRIDELQQQLAAATKKTTR
jgi:chaperonin cofactor prefoldin